MAAHWGILGSFTFYEETCILTFIHFLHSFSTAEWLFGPESQRNVHEIDHSLFQKPKIFRLAGEERKLGQSLVMILSIVFKDLFVKRGCKSSVWMTCDAC